MDASWVRDIPQNDATTHFCPYMSSPGFCLVLSFLFSFLDLYLFAVYFEEHVESWQLFHLSQNTLVFKPTRRAPVFLRNDLLRFPGNKSSLSMKLGVPDDTRFEDPRLDPTVDVNQKSGINSPVEGRVVEIPIIYDGVWDNIQGGYIARFLVAINTMSYLSLSFIGIHSSTKLRSMVRDSMVLQLASPTEKGT